MLLEQNVTDLNADIFQEISQISIRHQKVQRLEKKLQALTELFEKTHIVVLSAQQSVDTTQNSTEKTKEEIYQSKKILQRAVDLVKKKRVKRNLCTFFLVVSERDTHTHT